MPSLSLHSDVRSQVLSIKDRRNGMGKLVFKLAPSGNGQVFALTAPDLRVPGQGVQSRASFRRQPLSGQKTFTVLSLHINNIYDRKRGIGKKLIRTIRAVMLDEQGGLCGQ